jgi:hypothetical protein
VAHLIRGDGPRSRTRRARRSRRNGRISRAYTREGRSGRTAGGSDQHRRDADQPRDGSDTAKGRSEPHGRRRHSKEGWPGRDNSPSSEPGTCAEGKAATNDPRGRRLHELAQPRRREAPKTAGASSNSTTADVGVGAMRNANQRRSGMVRRPVASATERRGRRTPKGRDTRNLTRGGRPACPPRARRAATDAGPVEDGGPASTTPWPRHSDAA